MKSAVKIQNDVMNAVEALITIEGHLQREFEWFCQWFGSGKKIEKILEAKKKQQAALRSLLDSLHVIFDGAGVCSDDYIKLQGCLLYYGVSPAEVELFIKQTRSFIEKEVGDLMREGVVQVPEKLQGFIDPVAAEKRWVEKLERDVAAMEGKIEAPEVLPATPRFSDRPVLGVDFIKQIINKK